ncbi:MAG: S41 family peptidase [Prevotellaceae bacterium]|nr:S41 family peptidase [Prevotellaceae bacterium]
MNKKNILLFFPLFCLFVMFSCRRDIVIKDTPENVFTSFWKILDENYVYFEEKGIDWDSVYSVYYQIAKEAKTDAELIPIFKEIIPAFKDRHVSIQAFDYPYMVPIIYDSATVKSTVGWNYDMEEKYGLLPRYFRFSEPFTCWQHKEKRYAMIEISSFAEWDFMINQTTPQDIFVFLDSLHYENGLIIDVRLNSGGLGGIMYSIASPFFRGRHLAYYDVFKTGTGHNGFSEKFPQYFDGRGIVPASVPVILLIGNETFSAGNFFAYVMNDLPNCTAIGEKTGGGGGAINYVRLPNNWLLSYPWYKSYSTKGENMEFGLEPDVRVKVCYDFEDGAKDSVILKALEVLDNINRR